MDIFVDPDTGDIVYDNADLPLVTEDSRQDVAQRLRIKLQTYLGEWFLNIENGVPYYERVLRKGVRKEDIDVLFQSLIREEDGVLEIVEFESTLSPSREYNMRFRVRTDEGQTSTINITI